jgi:LacI family transcriptional regulator
MATIKDVAARAGVSAATVSRALSGVSYVSPGIEARIRKAVAELDYTPNRLASNLRRQSSMTIGLLISDVKNPFFAAVARAVEDLATQHGYSTVLCNSDDDLVKERRYLDVLLSERVAGLIVTPADEHASSIAAAVEASVPVVCVDRRIMDADADTVVVDNIGGVSHAVDLLVNGGCSRIAIVVGREQTTTATERVAGYRDGLRRHSIPIDEALVVHSDIRGGDTTALYDAEGRLGAVIRDENPDAVIITNGPLIPGSLAAITRSGRTVGTDIAVVAFDELALSEYVGLTTITQPTDDIAGQAVRLLLERMAGDAGPSKEVVFRPKLVERASSVLTARP